MKQSNQTINENISLPIIHLEPKINPKTGPNYHHHHHYKLFEGLQTQWLRFGMQDSPRLGARDQGLETWDLTRNKALPS